MLWRCPGNNSVHNRILYICGVWKLSQAITVQPHFPHWSHYYLYCICSPVGSLQTFPLLCASMSLGSYHILGFFPYILIPLPRWNTRAGELSRNKQCLGRGNPWTRVPSTTVCLFSLMCWIWTAPLDTVMLFRSAYLVFGRLAIKSFSTAL